MMAEEFRYALIIIGVLSMVALVIHGLWSTRKNSHETKSRFFQDENSGSGTGEGFDEFGVGKIRKLGPGEKPQPKPEVVKAPRASKLREPAKKIRRDDVDPQFSANHDREEPSMSFSADDDYDTEQQQSAPAAEPMANEVLILYVLMPEGTDINGAMLLPSLLTLGFKYGEMNIFHRFQDNAGSGEVLFSLANMFNPGTFDLEDMDKMNTRGLSLFMTLPGPGEALQNFNLMHSAAKKLADEFGGQVLDGQRSVLTVQTVRHYVEKIREFQRQRLIHG